VPKWYEMSRAIELYINSDKKLNANVDFYSASTYATLASTSTSIRLSRRSAASPAGPPTSRAVGRQPPHPSPRRVHRTAVPLAVYSHG